MRVRRVKIEMGVGAEVQDSDKDGPAIAVDGAGTTRWEVEMQMRVEFI